MANGVRMQCEEPRVLVFRDQAPVKVDLPVTWLWGATRWSRNAALSADRLSVSRVESLACCCRQCLGKGVGVVIAQTQELHLSSPHS
jgi:hypothetical protein